MNHVEGVRESIHSIDPFNSLSHNLNTIKKENANDTKLQMFGSPVTSGSQRVF